MPKKYHLECESSLPDGRITIRLFEYDAQIARKYENVQKGMGDVMVGALIETEARTILNQGKAQGIRENQRQTALRMLKRGKQTVEEIAEDTGLSVAEAEQLAGLQIV